MNITPKISVLAIGNELLDGRVTDTNSNWIGFELRRLGLSLHRTATCGDTISEIVSSLKFLYESSDIILTSGGLGPTTDDLTRDGVASLAGVKVTFCQKSMEQVEAYFAKRNRTVNDANKRQAYIPEGSLQMENPVGSAPGFIFKFNLNGVTKCLFALPGVPPELKEMCITTVFPSIKKDFPALAGRVEVGFRVFGLPESEIGQRLEGANLGEHIEVCYRVVFPEIEILLRGNDSKILHSAYEKSVQAIGAEYVLSESPNESLPNVVMKMALAKNLRLASAESCTGGMLGEILTSMSGSSGFYDGGFVTYSNSLKEGILGVSPTLIKAHGAVSSEVAEAMAQGALEKSGADYAISITGVAGPTGGSVEKPVGTAFVGLASKQGTLSKKMFYPAQRDRIRRYAAFYALDLLRREILSNN
jgi:nicotinamide-nucleotide amidase